MSTITVGFGNTLLLVFTVDARYNTSYAVSKEELGELLAEHIKGAKVAATSADVLFNTQLRWWFVARVETSG